MKPRHILFGINTRLDIWLMVGIIITGIGIALGNPGVVGAGGGMSGSIISDIIILRIQKKNSEANFIKARVVMVAIGLAIIGVILPLRYMGMFQAEMIGGLRYAVIMIDALAIGMVLGSIISLVLMAIYKKNPSKLQEYETLAKEATMLSNDERNVAIKRRASSISWHVTFWATVIVGVISWLYSFSIITLLIGGLALLHICCLCVGLWVYHKKM